MQQYKEDFIKFLVKSNTLKFGDFTLKSGRKCPYFLNLGQFYTGELITQLGAFYAAALRGYLKDYDVVFGPAYKGIPLSVAVCMSLYERFGINVAYGFNRKETKDHGEGGLIVGAPITKDSKLVIVDDVMTAGTALRGCVELLKQHGNPEITGVLIAIDRLEKGQGEKSAVQELKDEFGIKVYSIVSIEEIVSYLYDKEIDGTVHIDNEKFEKIKEYRKLYGVDL